METKFSKVWENTFGPPNFFKKENQLIELQIKLEDLQFKLKDIEKEIKNRANNTKIDEAIDLYFIIKSGKEYYERCKKYYYENIDEYESSDIYT